MGGKRVAVGFQWCGPQRYFAAAARSGVGGEAGGRRRGPAADASSAVFGDSWKTGRVIGGAGEVKWAGRLKRWVEDSWRVVGLLPGKT